MTGYFEPIGDNTYRPSEHAVGAWNADEIHFSPLGGLIVHAIDQHRAATGASTGTGISTGTTTDDKVLGRISFDILGFLAFDDCTIRVETIRPGRTIELIEATVEIRGRRAVAARAWFISPGDTSAVAGGEPQRMPRPEVAEPWPMAETWAGGYVASLEVRVVEPPRPGRTRAWLRTAVTLVDGEDSTAHASFIALVDTANGIAVRQSPGEWMFPNLDLTVHLHRQPVGRWVGLDTSVIFGAAGLGLTSSVLHDESGPIGRAEQILTVRPMP